MLADKNITMRQKDNSDIYTKLYPKTTATQSKLSTETAALFGDNITDADAAMRVVANSIKAIGNVQVKVVDGNGNPIAAAPISGIVGASYTNSDGLAQGIAQSDTVTVQSPFVELQGVTVNVKQYIGSLDTVTITLPTQDDGYIARYTSSQNIKFSRMTKSVDVCCVGGGGGGSGGYGHYEGTGSTSFIAQGWEGKGGGGGNIINKMNIAVGYNTSYPLVIGSGGNGSLVYRYTASHAGEQKANPAGNGGTTSFLGVEATGGTGGSTTPGASDNGGSGDSDGATGSEFNDGKRYYSGGGANGKRYSSTSGQPGGSPYGGSGGYYYSDATMVTPIKEKGGDATGPGGGGGGGCGARENLANRLASLTNGGNGSSGLVAIRFHF